ncbi:MAG: T9SS type A sorting domain-containing protein [Flavobacteriaceae bacterium]|nr:T9SS type A sorting domain-containing protein [Flavobacteriaceae bacterium]
MKKLNLLYILFCVGFISNAQIQEENFNGNSLPSGWSATTPTSGCTWQFGYTGNLEGSGSGSSPIYASFASGGVIFNDDDCGLDKNNYIELEGPTVDLVAANVVSAGIELVYNHQTFGVSGNFMVDVWDGSTWQNVLFVDADDTAPNTGTSQTANIDVSAYINSSFKVKFIYDDENTLTWGVGVDNYKLLNTATANIGDLVDLGFNYYPNPVVDDVLTLQANEEISIINVYNMIGQKVIAKKPITLESKLNMENLPEGMYIVNVAIGKKEGSFKVIKQ